MFEGIYESWNWSLNKFAPDLVIQHFITCINMKRWRIIQTQGATAEMKLNVTVFIDMFSTYRYKIKV